ncbi:glycosyltransferase family 39 protein [Butyrivibrio sp. XPD2002]|uniref:glycosyltransferase family 39 protein n=1 Tax=Butyrivibrio sp. XPD2002 TaxID=1280665 RepID=UPI001A9859FF|nr:glycosyltransferase family 39 protein [Butyrivibrio sp. XPD2002]
MQKIRNADAVRWEISLLRESNESEESLTLYDYLPQEPIDMLVVLTVIGMAFYYIWRATYLTPWYDELYTYYYFISRGPVYAAIHWPLPNNHVGYSVLSSLLDMFGNSYIGLRGVSFICAVVNPLLVYRLSKKFMEDWYSYGAMLLYFCCMLVNDLSIQGRGYTLGCTCFLLVLRQLTLICRSEEFKLIDYILFGIFLILGLYTLPSSIYWVIPSCCAAAFFLIVNGYRSYDFKGSVWNTRYFKRLKNCIITGLISAVIVFGLYLVIWLAVGSNLLVKDEASVYFGMSHVKLILTHPLAAAKEGLDYMLSQPYIQSVSRIGYMQSFVEWCKSLCSYMYPGFNVVTLFLSICALIILIAECIRHFENSRTIFNLLMIFNIIGYPIMLIIQAKLPYYRVFSYVGVLSAISFAYVLEHLSRMARQIIRNTSDSPVARNIFATVPVIGILIFVIFMMTKPEYNAQYGQRETNCYNALYIAHPSENKNICALDCDQQYLLKFGWGIECENTDVTDCDYILIDRNMMEEGYTGSDYWKFYVNFETIPWDYVNSHYYIFYENEDFVLYKR